MAKGKYKEWLTEAGLLLIEGWARDGLKDEEIADKLHIGMTTYYRWQTEHREIREAIKRGKFPVDYEVESAVKNSATGYYVTVRKPMKLKSRRHLEGKGLIEEEHIEFVEEQVYIPPNPTAQIFWLKNRRPDKWRDRRDDPQKDLKQADVEDLTPLVELLNEPDTDD